MNWKTGIRSLIAVALLAGASHADSPFFKQFKADYGTLDQDLLNNVAETGPVKDFVYHKDVATLTLQEGTIYFLRYVKDRPTTAFFIGKGHMSIEVPSHVERQSLWYAARDSIVNEDFDVCFIRMADDFDLKIKEKFPMVQKQLSWKDVNIGAKQSQGEFHFKPIIQHRYDNYFELLRSTYERKEDGYFWIDFNRYTYTFDPNMPEQSIVGYEHEAGAFTITDGAVMQRKERNIYADSIMSDIAYPTTIESREVSLDLGGLEGTSINRAQADLRILINADSLKFMSLFLHFNLSLDSMRADGVPADFMRRRDFNFAGVILPKYYRKGDTVTLRIWYHGTKYLSAMPYVENPAVAPVKLMVVAPSEFNYVVPGMGTVTRKGGKQTFTAEPQEPYNQFVFQPYANNFDSTVVSTSVGIQLTFLKSPDITKTKYDCYVADQVYQKVVKEGVEFIAARLGNPPGSFGLSILPTANQVVAGSGDVAIQQGVDAPIPGIAEVPQVKCLLSGDGEFPVVAGPELAKQWFGELMRPASERENWLAEAANEYIGLMYVQSALPGGPFYTELLRRKQDFQMIYLGRGNDRPLATGERVSDSLRTTKGAWVFHMLRELMQAVGQEKGIDNNFYRFLQELSNYVSNRTFTNEDIERIAEKHYGQSLDWFFDFWLYGRNIPEFTVTYNYSQQGADWYIDGTVQTKGVDASFQMPVICRVENSDGSSAFGRPVIKGNSSTFHLGPYPARPKNFVFNEYFSVLSVDNVSQTKK